MGTGTTLWTGVEGEWGNNDLTGNRLIAVSTVPILCKKAVLKLEQVGTILVNESVNDQCQLVCVKGKSVELVDF